MLITGSEDQLGLGIGEMAKKIWLVTVRPYFVPFRTHCSGHTAHTGPTVRFAMVDL
jgi:hypothetical protein